MQLRRLYVSNFMGISSPIELQIDKLTVLIGKNDVGKSTILKALDVFFNESAPDRGLLNQSTEQPSIEIACSFDPNGMSATLDEGHTTTFEAEDLIDESGFVQLKKVWTFTNSRVTSEVFVRQKVFANQGSLLLLSQRELMARCGERGIQTNRANGEEFNNAEKRQKLKESFVAEGIETSIDWIQLSTTGTGRSKRVYEGIKGALPYYEYFRADSSLNEGDTATQNYLRSVVNLAVEGCGGQKEEIESAISIVLQRVLGDLTERMNRSLPIDSVVRANITYDWSKLVKVNFETTNDDGDIPLSQRGDGFRRVTMMSFFEHLAEQSRVGNRGIVFAFEEPETFLHPSAQEKLFESLSSLADSDYRVVICTHSPIIVSCSPKDSLVHVSRDNSEYRLQKVASYRAVADDLGISIKNQFITTLDDSKVLFLVEGPDDVKAFRHICKLYKDEGLVDCTLEALGVQLLPIGGKDSIKHLMTLQILKQLNRPFFLWLDSDKTSPAGESPNLEMLLGLGLVEGVDFALSYKRAMENYISASALSRINGGVKVLYDDFQCVKKYCKTHEISGKLGGKNVLDKHFESLNISDLRDSFRHEVKEDEFLYVYGILQSKIPATT